MVLKSYRDPNASSFEKQLSCLGLQLRDISGDGNCLFRALGDQLEGHSHNHLKFRRETVNYMCSNREDFEPFIEDNCSFTNYVEKLRQDGTFAGNDAIVAFARQFNVKVVIHQLCAPVWIIDGNPCCAAKELHIAYHNGDHYSSVRRINDNSNTPAGIFLSDLKDQKRRRSKCSPYPCTVDTHMRDIMDIADGDDCGVIEQSFEEDICGAEPVGMRTTKSKACSISEIKANTRCIPSSVNIKDKPSMPAVNCRTSSCNVGNKKSNPCSVNYEPEPCPPPCPTPRPKPCPTPRPKPCPTSRPNPCRTPRSKTPAPCPDPCRTPRSKTPASCPDPCRTPRSSKTPAACPCLNSPSCPSPCPSPCPTPCPSPCPAPCPSPYPPTISIQKEDECCDEPVVIKRSYVRTVASKRSLEQPCDSVQNVQTVTSQHSIVKSCQSVTQKCSNSKMKCSCPCPLKGDQVQIGLPDRWVNFILCVLCLCMLYWLVKML